MLYIHNISCISPQNTFSETDPDILHESADNKLKALEPSYEGIPNNILRRMGKAVRISVGAALPLLQSDSSVNGIIIGTANGGMEDCIKFMNQIIQYDEGMLTPGNFVQSTPNGLAAQIALLKRNTGYNITHVHRGLSFENAVIDAGLVLQDFPERTYLLGAADEISSYNYNVDFLAGWYKKETVSNKDLYLCNSPASVAGEGAVMLTVNSKKEGALAELKAIRTLHSNNAEDVANELRSFVKKHLPETGSPDILLHGENGDNRLLHYYETAEQQVTKKAALLRFKHMCGEFPTASGQALYFACKLLETQHIPVHMIKRPGENSPFNTVLIYNNYKGEQHSFMLVSIPA